MKNLYRIVCCTFLMVATACAPRERTLVILSTNDMHAKIENFPRLAAAVAACRDTTRCVLLVDAGDRWTGNAYVDMAPTPGMPIIALMNRLGYNVATLGNHEFDRGQAALGRMIDSLDFEVVCANVLSDTCTFPQLPPYVVIECDGVRIGVAGVVTNYEGPGHPAGNASSFVGLRFPDPQQAARDAAAQMQPEVDVRVLLSHMGDDRDEELLARGVPYEVLIGGHTHVVRDTLINGTLLSQTGKNLTNVGVTRIHLRGKQVVGVDFELVPLAGYAPDTLYTRLVEAYYAEPELNRPVGRLVRTADKWGLANWVAEAMRDEADAEVGIYHIGGVRLDSLAGGGVGKARVFDLEPFGTRVATARMTPEQLRRAIIAKYNDTENRKEAHRIDMIATTPYVIVTDAADNALDVKFPALREDRVYKVAMSDYIYKNYKQLEYADGEITDLEITDLILDDLEDDTPVTPDNTPKQAVQRRN